MTTRHRLVRDEQRATFSGNVRLWEKQPTHLGKEANVDILVVAWTPTGVGALCRPGLYWLTPDGGEDCDLEAEPMLPACQPYAPPLTPLGPHATEKRRDPNSLKDSMYKIPLATRAERVCRVPGAQHFSHTAVWVAD